MDPTRKITPRVHWVPDQPRQKPKPDSDRPNPLTGAVLLTTGDSEDTLFSERVLIGRGQHCQVVILDPLVSREHALLRISPTEVVVEDLRSANGVYVNNVRIFEPQPLYDGDRILVGTQELCLFSADPRSTLRQTPVVRPHPAPMGTPEASSTVATDKADALIVLGRVAQRMLEIGLPAEAELVLTDHLQNLLSGARSGLPVPAGTCTLAARQALGLAKALGSGRWFNYAIELHLRAGLRMNVELANMIADAVSTVSRVDHALFGYYVEWLRDRVERHGPESDIVLGQLASLKLPRT